MIGKLQLLTLFQRVQRNTLRKHLTAQRTITLNVENLHNENREPSQLTEQTLHLPQEQASSTKQIMNTQSSRRL